MQIAKLEKSGDSLISLTIKFGVAPHPRLSPIKGVNAQFDDYSVGVAYGFYDGKADQIVIVSGTIRVRDGLKGECFEQVTDTVAKLLGVRPVELLRMIMTADLDLSWSLEFNAMVVIPRWREIVVANDPDAAEVRSMRPIQDRVKARATTTHGAWLLD